MQNLPLYTLNRPLAWQIGNNLNDRALVKLRNVC
jgi:hypothetical protein